MSIVFRNLVITILFVASYFNGVAVSEAKVKLIKEGIKRCLLLGRKTDKPKA